MSAKADLHVHSKHSNQPGAWVLRQVGAPESYTEPLEIYRRCREQGMDFVTISDHDTISGALEIAHLPGTFLSSEITARFPEDGCAIHLLVLGVSETQFGEIDRLRGNLYELAAYLDQEGILSSVAHPLYRVNDKLTGSHWERLLLLFERFETVNGARDPRAGDLCRLLLSNLTPQFMAELADRHGITPRFSEPWRKRFTGGSDDHSGLYLAAAYTETPPAATLEEFLGRLRRGQHRPRGEAGSSLKLARAFTSIAQRFLAERSKTSGGGLPDLTHDLLSRLLESPEEAPGWVHKVRLSAAGLLVAGRRRFTRRTATFGEQALEIVSTQLAESGKSAEVRVFDTACELSQSLVASALERAVAELRAGRPAAAFRALAGLSSASLTVAPYLASFHTQHKDDAFLHRLAERYPVSRSTGREPKRKAWFTDTLLEVNGVARTIRETAALAREQGVDLEVIYCGSAAPPEDVPAKQFQPVAEFPLPQYESIPVALPPLLEVLSYCESRRFDEVIVSTPGPVGLAGLAAAKLLRLPVSGIYHTDFPAYARALTAHPLFEQLARWLMRSLYGTMSRVYAPSRATLEQLVRLGLDRAKLKVMPRGVDHQLFHLGRRVVGFWEQRGLTGRCRFVYVGRVSKEKNLDTLLVAFEALVAGGIDADLIVVGDGPHRAELETRHAGARVCFTGFLEGPELASAYASSDVFVFPSTTDTFGNAVLEAHASGLPAIVADKGGPPEIVRRGPSGLVYDPKEPGQLVRAMELLAKDPERRTLLARKAVEQARGANWDTLLSELWSNPPAPQNDELDEIALEWPEELERVSA